MSKLMNIRKVIPIVAFLLGAIAAATAQPRATAEDVKALLLLQFAENIRWPQEDRLHQFRIGVYEDDTTMIRTLKEFAERKSLRGKPVQIVSVFTMRDLDSVQLLYLNEERSLDVRPVVRSVIGKGILVVSCEGEPKSSTMINLILTPDSRYTYDMNRPNVEEEGLVPLGDLLFWGVSRQELREIVRQTEDSVRIERERAERQQLLIEEQARVIDKQRGDIASQRLIMDEQDLSILQQRRLLDSIEVASDSLREDLAQSAAVFAIQNRSIRAQGDTIAEQQGRVRLQNETLSDQQRIIEERRREIEEQDRTLLQQSSTIEWQQRMLAVVVISSLVLSILLFFIYRNYKTIRRINLQLEQQNAKIESQRDALEQQARLLKAANEELDSFSYSVSHDLRAPLRSIHGFSDAIREEFGTTLGQQGTEYLGRVQGAAQKMSALIDDLLKLSRVGRNAIQVQETDLSFIARAVIAELQRTEPERRVDVVIPESVKATADPRMMTIVLQNLLSNAWKYSSKKEHARIEFGTEAQDGEPVYFVRDNGAGFSTQYKTRLFAPFQRLHTDEEFAGSGVGLSIVKRIVHRHGGRIWAEGEPDRGATFRFTLQASMEAVNE